jgi:hypothetical protein
VYVLLGRGQPIVKSLLQKEKRPRSVDGDSSTKCEVEAKIPKQVRFRCDFVSASYLILECDERRFILIASFIITEFCTLL